MSASSKGPASGPAELEQILVVGEDPAEAELQPLSSTQCARAGSELSQESGIVLGNSNGNGRRAADDEIEEEDDEDDQEGDSYYHDLESEEEEQEQQGLSEGIVNEG